jgi:hypothetical protein
LQNTNHSAPETAEPILDSTVHDQTQQASVASTSPQPSVSALTLDEPHSRVTSTLDKLLNNGAYRVKEEHELIQRRTVETSASQPAIHPAANACESIVFSPPAAASLPERHRNGKIARLPKLERDMVNKLLQNNTPYSKIAWALAECGIKVTERNISNWRTRGGYKEWSAEQENQLRLAHIQDHLTDYLRKHDAEQLPEVGLQVAATQLTSLLMNPQSAGPLLADPGKYSKIVEMLDKCSARLAEMQEKRYDNLRRSHIKDTTYNLRWQDENEVESIRQVAGAAKLGSGPREPNVPHRNDLPPREEMPRHQPQSFGDMIAVLKALKQPEKAA